MTDRNELVIEFPAFKGRKVLSDFSGGEVTSDGGVLLLKEADRLLGLTKKLAKVLSDPRDRSRCQHSLQDLLRQRIFGLALGYEDGNDHQTLRHDIGLQTAVGKSTPLASPSTICRMEQWFGRTAALQMHNVVVEQFLDSFSSPPRELILDLDATDDQVHGNQEGRFFNGYYDHYCFLPLYIFCGNEPLVSYLRPSNRDGASHAAAIVRLLVTKIRSRYPDVRIIIRADSGFCRQRLIRWCERSNVFYVIGLAKNSRLLAATSDVRDDVRESFEKSSQPTRRFSDLFYAAASWDKERRVIVKAEHLRLGANPRFIVTNMSDGAKELYENIYCARGEMENRIKESQLQLFADRTSCHDWWANQFRLLLSSFAYLLIQAIRRIALSGTELARAQAGTIRLKLFKIGAVLVRNTRRVLFHLSSAYPYQDLFRLVAYRLQASG